MGTTSRPGAGRWVRAARRWAIWELPGWLKAYVLTVIAADVAAIIIAVAFVPLQSPQLELFAVLLACDVATVELTRGSGEPAGLIKEAHAVWELPLALLLPPLYGLIAPIARIALTQWRVRRALPHRRVFTAAALGLSYAAGSVAFHPLSHDLTRLFPSGPTHALAFSLAIAVCGVLRSAINKLLVITAVKGADRAVSIRAALFTREPLFGDAAELSVGVMVASAVTASPFMALFALPFVTLMQRSLRHTQLVSDARIDGKTGLLNAVTWQREAAVQITRAIRTRAPLAVAIADIDHFKAVNDTFGHPVGDVVLAATARTLKALLRDYDLCGRFGGEEFAILLPDTTATEAADIAERLCAAIPQITIPPAGSATSGTAPHVTISIGIAALDSTHRDLDELVAAADHALYQAKQAGRNTVRMIPAS